MLYLLNYLASAGTPEVSFCGGAQIGAFLLDALGKGTIRRSQRM